MNRQGLLDQLRDVFRKPNNAVAQLILINAIAFVALNGIFGVFIAGLMEIRPVYVNFMNWISLPSNLWLEPGATGPFLARQPWSLFTYMFLHSGFFHILFNMLFLYVFGRIIQDYLGGGKVISLYVLGGLLGGIVYIISYNTFPLFSDTQGIMVGASAGVFAIVMGAALYMPNYTINLLLIGPVRIKYIALFYLVGFIFQVTGDNAGGELAHLGGALAGYLYISQMQRGRDLGRWIHVTLDWIKGLFKPKPKIKVTYRSSDTKSQRSTRAQSAKSSTNTTSRSAKASEEEINAILDKISDGGYDSLTKEEKQKLFNASRN